MREGATRVDTVSTFLLDDQEGKEDEFDVDGAGLNAQSASSLALEGAVHGRRREEACHLFRCVDPRQLAPIASIYTRQDSSNARTSRPTPRTDFHLYSTPSLPTKHRELEQACFVREARGDQ